MELQDYRNQLDQIDDQIAALFMVMPPSTPPAWLVRAVILPSSTAKGSLCSLPRIPAAAKPVPAGAFALQILEQKGITVAAHIGKIADVVDAPPDFAQHAKLIAQSVHG